MPGEWARQGEYAVRFGWAVPAVEVMGGDVIVIVDVLRFTTAVEAGASRGAVVFPYRWRDGSAAVFAESVGARLADGHDPLGPSLSPASLLTMKAGDAVVLPSPNGSTCAAAAKAGGATVVAACLRNASAVGEWISEQVSSRQGSVSVIACGERWPDGSLRPALEDLLGAGAVLARLHGPRSPDARAAISAWQEASATVDGALLECPSGRELIERGRLDDVSYAAQVDVSRVVPVLRDGAFRCSSGSEQMDVLGGLADCDPLAPGGVEGV
jgi:2-phosphosulfolactate phosphatase